MQSMPTTTTLEKNSFFLTDIDTVILILYIFILARRVETKGKVIDRVEEEEGVLQTEGGAGEDTILRYPALGQHALLPG